MRIIFYILLLLVAACQTKPRLGQLERINLERREFSSFANWLFDDHELALQAFKKSCSKVMSRPPNQSFGGLKLIGGYVKDWQGVCKTALSLGNIDDETARKFFEAQFVPFAIITPKSQQGLFTGYYEPLLKGSAKKNHIYKHPIYKLPDNPQAHSRKAIHEGALANLGYELLYVDDEVELFFLHIQGSGRVKLEDGTVIHIGYAGQNGHKYYAIGRVLVEKHNVDSAQISAEYIKTWLRQNNHKARLVMEENPSYVFFKISNKTGAVGGQGVVLTPGRSLAIDKRYIPYSAPLWLETHMAGGIPFEHLMVAQDTGGAIRGPIRGDIFFGHGKEAAISASEQKYQGQYYILLPKSIANKH